MRKIFFTLLCPLILFAVPYPNPSRAPSSPFVSGDGFRAYADYVYDEEDVTLNPLEVNPNGTIFVKGDYLKRFFEELHPHIPNKYILITHNSDEYAPGPFENFLEDEKIIAWFAQRRGGGDKRGVNIA